LKQRRDAGFAWRSGENVTRIEGFSDAVFGFAITLLVLSLEIPQNSVGLLALVEGLPAFAGAFAVLVLIWHSHCLFFRRYGLQDWMTTVLNAVLLFVVIFYVYPLKFLFLMLTSLVFGLKASGVAISPEHSVAVLVIYALGVLAVFLLLALLYAHAWRLRELLNLSARERYITISSIQYHLVYCGVAALAISLTVVGGAAWIHWAAFSFALLGPACGFHGWWSGRNLPDSD